MKTPRMSYHMTENQIPIMVGKDSFSNDYLTFILSEPDDLWFHVCDSPGAHVVLQNLPNVNQSDIETAARLAVKHSKVCGKKKIYKVHYSPISYVSKPKHAPPGQVEVSNERYLHVTIK
jgi:predicted ribosome quality control (RQC) complex YloA/Tae2 family protein